ncbi:MAG: zf-HC2 domain-containing protein [Actinomycetota bacterium]
MTTGHHTPWPVDQARIDRNWRAITIELDSPRPGRIERLLRAIGFPAHITRLMVATPALRRAWFLATGLAILVGLGATDAGAPRDQLFVLLLIAPLVPVLGVSMAYGVEADPAHEMAVAAPIRGLRLILTRAAVVLACSSGLLGLAGLAAPGRTLMAFAWLLPSVGLTAVTVALMSMLSPRRAAAVVMVTWTVGVLMVRGGAEDPLRAFTLGGQLVMAALAVLALVIAVVRRDRFDRLSVSS